MSQISNPLTGAIHIFWPVLAEPGPERLAPFLIDKFEVSNRQFKQFVESGVIKRRITG